MRKRRLGDELRKLREAADVSVEAAAVALDCSPGKVRHIENGRNAPKMLELAALVSLYGGGPDRLEALESIRREATRPGWWSTARLPTYMQTYVGAETDASSVRVFALELIPGLLQVQEYTYGLNQLGGVQDIDRIVAVRTRRQQRLVDEEDPLNLHAVFSEAALRRLASASYAKAQLRHLVSMAELDNITIQILPFSSGIHVSMSGGFVLLDFDEDVSLPAAYFENVVAGEFVDDQVVVARIEQKFTALRELAMEPDKSVRFIKEWM